MPTVDFTLRRDAFGKLVFAATGGEAQEEVVPVRAFPLAAPDEGVALVGTDGHEVLWIENIAELPAATRQIIEEELASRDFTPEIRRIVRVSGFATPSTWQVETDRGPTQLVLKGEEDIRRLAHKGLLIADANGIHFRIRDLAAMDKGSRRILDRFL